MECNKEILEELINNNLSIAQIAEKLNKGKTSIRYWLKKYELKTNHTQFSTKDIKRYESTHRICPGCLENKTIDNFYKKKGILFNSTYCKQCTNSKTVQRMKLFKQKCLEYKGGKCIICNYNKYYGALEFHHIDSSIKEFSISTWRSYSFNKFVTEELDKCVLLCSNCHREVEGGIVIL